MGSVVAGAMGAAKCPCDGQVAGSSAWHEDTRGNEQRDLPGRTTDWDRLNLGPQMETIRENMIIIGLTPAEPARRRTSCASIRCGSRTQDRAKPAPVKTGDATPAGVFEEGRGHAPKTFEAHLFSPRAPTRFSFGSQACDGIRKLSTSNASQGRLSSSPRTLNPV